MTKSLTRCLVAATLALVSLGAIAQSPGHLNVPGLQMVQNQFAVSSGLPSHHYQWLGMVLPDARVEPMQADLLAKRTLVLMDFIVLVARPGGPAGVAESGEIYLGDVDSTQKMRPLQDQLPIVRYTMPANESRLVLQVTLAGGRAFSGYRQPVFVHYGPPGVQINPRALGYVVPN